MFLFFQAEDGIRDLVRSRGLGDVYKRQAVVKPIVERTIASCKNALKDAGLKKNEVDEIVMAVSYTHLTLPTSDLV